MSWVRIWAIAYNGFREVIRDRLLYFVGFFTLLLVIALRLLPEISAGTDEKIFIDFGLSAISVLTALIAIFVGAGLINKEIDKRTLLILIPKPISRAEFVLGKHLGLWTVITVMVSVMTVVYFGMLLWSQMYFPFGTMAISIIYLLLELALMIAVAIVFGVLTSSILATLLSFGIYLMGQISRDILELGKLSENPSIEWITKTIYLVIPDLSRLNLRNEAVYGLLPSPGELVFDACYGLFYTGLLLGIAILVFSQKEF